MSEGSLQQLLDGITAQIAAGRTIDAIKLYRDATGAGLAEAKDAIELIAAGKPPKSADASHADAAAMQQVKEAIAAGNLIEAIRRHREATGLGLKDSKEAVERMAFDMDPAAFETRESAMRRTRRVALIAVLAFVGLVVLGILLGRP